MLISNRKCPEICLKINNQPIKRVNSYKCLGLVIDDKLNFSLHCNKVSGNLARISYILFKNKYYLSKSSKLLIYNSLAYPHLIYNVTIWGTAPKIYLNKVLVSQKRIIRSIMGDRKASATAGFADLKLLNISLIYEHQSLCYMFRIINNDCPSLTINSIKLNQFTHTHNTRQKDDIKIPLCSLSISQKSFSFQGPKMWNSLPPSIRNKSCSNSTFSKIIKNHLISLEIN